MRTPRLMSPRPGCHGAAAASKADPAPSTLLWAQLEGRLLAGTAHELTTAETIDRLGQTAFELVTSTFH
jgi:hypothetical protein